MKLCLLGVCVFLGTALVAAAADTQTDIEYARIDGQALTLDLHRPDKTNAPLLVYVHGGAWRAGSKSDVPIAGLIRRGYAIASVNYRLSTEAVFPAQIHDIKAAIRYLRAKSELYHIDTTRIAVIGSSAGGHLAALVGVTNKHAELEGRVGEHLDQSSDVQAIVSLFGASNLQTILAQSTPQGLKMRIPALELLLGGQPSEKPDLAKLASPVAHLDKQDPPLLLIHGDADPQMPPQQSREFAAAYQSLGLPVQFLLLPGSEHGGAEFYDEDGINVIATFLQTKLGGP